MKVHRIDLSPVKEEVCPLFDRRFKRCIGTGRIDLTLREDFMDNLRIVQNEIGFDMIRGHGLLSDQMGLYREYMDMSKIKIDYSRPIHNFNRVLKVFDQWLSHGIDPFVELGFMPSHLASGDQIQFWWKGNVTPPKDYVLWKKLIQDIVKTLIHHYGLESVRNWPFEVWNEPNLPQFWQNADEKEYHRLYRETALAIKEIDEHIQVGGPATSPGAGAWTPRLIQLCDQENIPLDFIAHHIYLGAPADNREEFVYMKFADVDTCREKFEEIPNYVKSSVMSHLPVHITEWNTSYSPRSLAHDTAFNAAYVAWILTHVGQYVDSFSYWTMCDVFEEQDIPKSIFHGGFGLLTEDGLRKPTFHAFSFADRLSGSVVHRDDVSCITRQEGGSYSGLFFRPDTQSQEGEGTSQIFELKIPFEKEAIVSIQYVDDQRGNAYTMWKKLGCPRWPDGREREILDRAQWPYQEIRVIEPQDKMIQVKFDIPTNGIALVEIFDRRDERSDYLGLGPELLTG